MKKASYQLISLRISCCIAPRREGICPRSICCYPSYWGSSCGWCCVSRGPCRLRRFTQSSYTSPASHGRRSIRKRCSCIVEPHLSVCTASRIATTSTCTSKHTSSSGSCSGRASHMATSRKHGLFRSCLFRVFAF